MNLWYVWEADPNGQIINRLFCTVHALTKEEAAQRINQGHRQVSFKKETNRGPVLPGWYFTELKDHSTIFQVMNTRYWVFRISVRFSVEALRRLT